MSVYFLTPLTIEECTERLQNGIDPFPLPHEQRQSAMQTTWAPTPLPHAGKRTSGYGYTAGTRPVIGSITDTEFRLEKRVVMQTRGGARVPSAQCIGHLSSTKKGTLIEVDVQRPGNAVVSIVFGIVFALISGSLVLMLLTSYLNGHRPTSSGDVFGTVVVVVMFLISLAFIAGSVQTGKAEEAYLFTFLKHACEARQIAGRIDEQGGYVGKTQRL